MVPWHDRWDPIALDRRMNPRRPRLAAPREDDLVDQTPLALPRRLAAAVAGAAVLLAACGSYGGASAPPSAASASAPAAAGNAHAVTLANDGTLGDILVGEEGLTLYIFTKDTSGKSVCNGDCAANWPPFVLEDDETVTAGAGVSGALATIVRDDGTRQVTYEGAPLYYFAADAKAGDTNGQGVGDVWFVATPSGSSGPAGSAGGGRYGTD